MMILWRIIKRILDVQKDNGVKLMVRVVRICVLYIVIVLIFVFVIFYLSYFVYVVYNMIVQLDISFEIDQVICIVNIIIVYLNSVINLIIYFM